MTNQLSGELGLTSIFKAFWGRILTTWLIVAIENILIALVPLLIGLSIDGLMAGQFDHLILMVIVLVVLGIVSVGRRIFDTRAYGAIRIHLGFAVDELNAAQTVSKRNTRLNLSRELVDFLEMDVPELLTSVIQIVVSLVVLTLFHLWLGVSSVVVIIAMLLLYALFHKRFFKLNASLNSQREKQVSTLDVGNRIGVFRHLRALQKTEVSISDTEAYVYGGIFLVQIAYIAYNLVLAAGLSDITAGRIFSIATYSWEYIEAALALPMALQSWTRLSEITARINQK